MRQISVCFACVLATAVLVRAQQPATGPATAPQGAATFRTTTDLVDVDVSVLDRRRLPVRGLTAADFTVYEDGTIRPVVAFSAVDLPRRVRPPADWMAEVAPDVSSNEVARAGRLVVLLIDRLVTPEVMPAVQAFARATIEQLSPADLAAVAYSTRGIPQNFTSDRRLLLAAIERPFTGLPEDDDGGEAECSCGRCSLESLAGIAEAIQDVRQRRKMILVVGSNLSIQSAGPCGGVLAPLRTRTIKALQSGNITVHAFDPAGLQTVSVDAAQRTGQGGRGMMALLQRRGNISVLPDETGGRVWSNTVRPGDAVAQIFQESTTYYVLGFVPAAAADRRSHAIRVKVNRPGMSLQTRRAYYAGGPPDPRVLPGPATTPTALRRAIAGLLPRADVPVSIGVVPLAAPDLRGGDVAVVLNVRPPADLPLRRDGTTAPGAPGRVDVLIGAFDRHGRVLATSRQTLELAPRNGEFEYEVVSRLALKPGRYEIRAAVNDTRFDRTGSVYTYVEVPDFRQRDATLSGLVLASGSGVPSVPGDALAGLMPVTPTLKRVFHKADQVTAFARLYQGLTRALMPGYVTARILDEADQTVFRQEVRVVPDQFGAGRATDLRVALPIDRLTPGAYLLTIDVRHGNSTARRDARFEVTSD